MLLWLWCKLNTNRGVICIIHVTSKAHHDDGVCVLFFYEFNVTKIKYRRQRTGERSKRRRRVVSRKGIIAIPLTVGRPVVSSALYILWHTVYVCATKSISDRAKIFSNFFYPIRPLSASASTSLCTLISTFSQNTVGMLMYGRFVRLTCGHIRHTHAHTAWCFHIFVPDARFSIGK